MQDDWFCPEGRPRHLHRGAFVHGHIIENFGDQPRDVILNFSTEFAAKHLPPMVCLSREEAARTRDFAALWDQS